MGVLLFVKEIGLQIQKNNYFYLNQVNNLF